MKTGLELIAEERARQMSEENWNSLHDDQHKNRELAAAALSYLKHYVARAWTFKNELGMPGITDGEETYRSEEMPDSWPWEEGDWKPKNPMRDIVRAGALIAAEIDRLQRIQE